MNLFKKFFNFPVKEDEEIKKQEVKLSLDDLFVHNFVKKGGKFLYSINEQELISNFRKVIAENNWEDIHLLDHRLDFLFDKKSINVVSSYNEDTTILTTCEHLIAENGDILFSSNQLKSTRLKEYPQNFIVFATTSQLVKDTGQGLTGIKTNCKDGSIPTNISAIKKYSLNIDDDNFLNYGNNNSKNLYLLLLEDL